MNSVINRNELLIHTKTDESQNNYAEWKKPDKRVYTAWFFWYKSFKNAN